MKLRKILLIGAGAIAGVLVLLSVVVAMQPSEFRLERSLTMDAPPSAPYAQVNDFHNWINWSPWAKLDPNVKVTYDGPDKGEGAVYSWVGNSEVGEGRMTILESQPNERVRIKLEFMKPFQATSAAEFTFVPEGDKTKVTWAMFGQNNFVGKAIHLCMDMDDMIGEQFVKGLKDMRAASEASVKKEAASAESPKEDAQTQEAAPGPAPRNE